MEEAMSRYMQRVDTYDRSRTALIAGSWWVMGIALGLFMGYLLWH